MPAVDASVLVSVFDGHEQEHGESIHALERTVDRGESLKAPTLVLAEVAGAVSRRTTRRRPTLDILAWIQSFPGLRVLPVTNALGVSAAEIASRLRIKGADAIYVALALAQNETLLTWDREVIQRAGALIDVSAPNEYGR